MWWPFSVVDSPNTLCLCKSRSFYPHVKGCLDWKLASGLEKDFLIWKLMITKSLQLNFLYDFFSP